MIISHHTTKSYASCSDSTFTNSSHLSVDVCMRNATSTQQLGRHQSHIVTLDIDIAHSHTRMGQSSPLLSQQSAQAMELRMRWPDTPAHQEELVKNSLAVVQRCGDCECCAHFTNPSSHLHAGLVMNTMPTRLFTEQSRRQARHLLCNVRHTCTRKSDSPSLTGQMCHGKRMPYTPARIRRDP